MKEIQLTKGKVAIVDDEDYEWLNQWKWYCHSQGYASRKSYNNESRKEILMHRLIMNVPDNMNTDHINHNRLDNRRCNLRICTQSQNCANNSMHRNNTSGTQGVWWDKERNKWHTEIWFHYKKQWIGRFDDFDEAKNAYNNKAKELFGEFAAQPRSDNG